MNVTVNGKEYASVNEAMEALKELKEIEKVKVIPNLSKSICKKYPDFHVREDLNFSDDGNRFKGYDYKGLPITTLRADGQTYLCIREDYVEEKNYTRNEWYATKEHNLQDEFNGVDAVDLNKLIENCEAILAKMEELNEKVKDEEVDMEDVKAQCLKEIEGLEVTISESKRMKWWTLSEYQLKDARRCIEQMIREVERLNNLYTDAYNLSRRTKKEWNERLESWGYLINEEGKGYWQRTIKEYIARTEGEEYEG